MKENFDSKSMTNSSRDNQVVEGESERPQRGTLTPVDPSLPTSLLTWG